MDDSELKTHVTLFANVAAAALTTDLGGIGRVRGNSPYVAKRKLAKARDTGRKASVVTERRLKHPATSHVNVSVTPVDDALLPIAGANPEYVR
jgi:hypothetical protein